MAVNQATIASRYAVALFELTHDQNLDKDTLAELAGIRAVMQENPDLVAVIQSERVSEKDKLALVDTVKGDASQLVKNLVQMTFDYRRFALLPTIIDDYEAKVNEADGKVFADVTTAVPLSNEQVTRLSEQLAKRLSANEVVLNQSVDESILGGVIIHANNQILDGSLATKLAAIRRSIIR
jgi:F-type H+-transporting ATPase subunit delta